MHILIKLSQNYRFKDLYKKTTYLTYHSITKPHILKVVCKATATDLVFEYIKKKMYMFLLPLAYKFVQVPPEFDFPKAYICMLCFWLVPTNLRSIYMRVSLGAF
jgi:hypothetical protein